MTRRYVNICEELVVVVVGVVVVAVVVAVFCSTRGNIIMVPKCRKVG
jgi:predicted lysophospholipase L1 biosynthesis ABC-type transport system permease subunit